jgi:DNA-binding NarL/FixJ family response regulator
VEQTPSSRSRAAEFVDKPGRRQGPGDRRSIDRDLGSPPARRAVAIVGRTTVFHEAVARALDAQPDVEVVAIGEAVNALDVVGRACPVVIVVAVATGDTARSCSEGLADVHQLRLQYPQVRVIVMTDEITPGLVADAARYGVSAFLSLDTSLADLLGAVRTFGDGTIVVSAPMLASILSRPECAPEPGRAHDVGSVGQRGLTARELQVLELLGQGIDQQSIAAQLGVSIHTCRGHVKRLLKKLDAHSQVAAVATAARLGLLSRASRPSPRSISEWTSRPDVETDSYQQRLQARPPA